jgi:hypothetical protein
MLAKNCKAESRKMRLMHLSEHDGKDGNQTIRRRK